MFHYNVLAVFLLLSVCCSSVLDRCTRLSRLHEFEEKIFSQNGEDGVLLAILDAILYLYIERRLGPKEIIACGYDPALVARILKLVNTNEYKRNQYCPIIRVSPKAFGIGRRIPIVGKYLS